MPSHKYGQSFVCVTLKSVAGLNMALQAFVDIRIAVQHGCNGAEHSTSSNEVANAVCSMNEKVPRTKPTV